MLSSELVGQSNFLNLNWQGLSKASTHPVTFPKLEWEARFSTAKPSGSSADYSLALNGARRGSPSTWHCLLTNCLWVPLGGAGGIVWAATAPLTLSFTTGTELAGCTKSQDQSDIPARRFLGKDKTTQELPQSHCQQQLVVTHPEALTPTKIQSGGDTGIQDTLQQYPHTVPSNTARGNPPPLHNT